VPKRSAEPVSTLSLQQRKQELVRSAIFDAALDLFAGKGYDETTIEDIAEKAGVSRRSFFRYFSSKGDVLASGLLQYGQYLKTAIDSFAPETTSAAIFRQTVLMVAQQSSASPRARKMMQILATHPAANEAQHARSAEFRKMVYAAFARRKKWLGGLDAEILANLTLGVLNVVFQTWFQQTERDVCAVAEQVLESLERIV
jgi:AcrR family transcriptional regulator